MKKFHSEIQVLQKIVLIFSLSQDWLQSTGGRAKNVTFPFFFTAMLIFKSSFFEVFVAEVWNAGAMHVCERGCLLSVRVLV